MKKLLLAIAITIPLAGCGVWDRTVAHYTGYSELCVDGVTYIQFTSGAAAKQKLDGSLVACK
jgi:uncharacterized protein YceK